MMTKEGESQFPRGREEVYDALLQGIGTIKGMKVKDADRASGQVVIKTSMSLASWGETVNLQVAEVGPNLSSVKIASKTKAQLVDWGKNKKNIEQILAATSAALGTEPIPGPSGEGAPNP